MEQPSSSLFKPAQPHQPVATLMLIENSEAMSPIWSDLRDNYLNGLVDNIVLANPSVPITVSVLESYPCQTHGSNSSLLRQYSGYHEGLRDLKFNPNPSNRITTSRINSCIEFLDAAKFQGHPPALHLIIVAATTPSEDDNDMGHAGNGYSRWLYLAQKMGSKNIHCHIVVSPQNDMGSLTYLFEETDNIEESPSRSPDPTKMLIRLSARRSYDPHNDIRSFSGGPVGTLRRNSYPLDNFCPETFDETTGAPISGEAPSLVSQLQQVHGLTKKKVYGAKPVRQPFFREERFREKYHRPTPTPLTLPPMAVMEQAPSPTAGGRAVSQSRADRISRVGQASPTEVHPRRHSGWARRGSRLSTPESDGLPWPPSPSAHHDISPGSSYMSSDLSSPVTPVTTMEEVYGHTTCIPPVPAPSVHGIPAGISVYQTGGTPESHWPSSQITQYPGSYNSGVQTYFPSAHNIYDHNGQLSGNLDIQLPNQAPIIPSYPSPPPATPIAPSNYNSPSSLPPIIPSLYNSPTSAQHTLPSSYTSAPSASYITPPPLPVVPSQMNASILGPAKTSPPPTVPASDRISRANAHSKPAPEEDEERFTFSSEFVTATAELFETEVLPAYPDYPGMSSGLYNMASAQPTLPPTLPASRTGELYASRNKQATELPINAITDSAPLPQKSHPHAYTHYTHAIPLNMRGSAVATYTNYSAHSAFSPKYVSGSSLRGWAG